MRKEQQELQDFTKTLFDFMGTIREETNNLLKPWDISMEQLRILQVLNECPHEDCSLTVEELKTYMLQKYSNVSRLIDKLLKKEYVEKVPSERDRRSVLIRLTPRGEQFLEKIDKIEFKPGVLFVENFSDKIESVKADVEEMTLFLSDIYRKELEK